MTHPTATLELVEESLRICRSFVDAGISLSPYERVIMEQAQQLSAAREALRPLAALADSYESFDGQHDFLDEDVIVNCLGAPLKVGHARAARSVLAASEPRR